MVNYYDIIFVLNGRELVRYDYENEFAGERTSTRESLAYENGVDINDIKIFYQNRRNFDITLFCYFSIYGEFQQLDYKNTFYILSECIQNKNHASVKVNNKVYSIGNEDQFKLFVEEFGPIEIES